MAPAPQRAGSRTVFAQFDSGREVALVSTGASIRLDEVGALPVVLDAVTAGRMLGLGRTTTYRLLRQGTFPVPVHRAGKVWVVPTAGVLAHLGLDRLPLLSAHTCGCGARGDHHKEGEP